MDSSSGMKNQIPNVLIPPWYNKEILIKLFKKNEGRDLDNRHPYPRSASKSALIGKKMKKWSIHGNMLLMAI